MIPSGAMSVAAMSETGAEAEKGLDASVEPGAHLAPAMIGHGKLELPRQPPAEVDADSAAIGFDDGPAPDSAVVDARRVEQGIELLAGEGPDRNRMGKLKLRGAGNAVVAAQLRRIEAAPERLAADMELLQRQQW